MEGIFQTFMLVGQSYIYARSTVEEFPKVNLGKDRGLAGCHHVCTLNQVRISGICSFVKLSYY